MRVLGVIDLLGGRAVRAFAGNRADYQPVERAAGVAIPRGDAEALARAYVRLGVSELYVADLDAILGRAPNDRVVAALGHLEPPMWLDQGISSADRAREAVALGATRIIAGLETLSSWEALRRICEAVGGARVAFSLDLRDGNPVLMRSGSVAPGSADRLAAHAAAAGVQAIIVLDLARVGTGRVTSVDTIARIRDAVPEVTLLAGGGISGFADVKTLAECGCDGVLIATALHEGQMDERDVAAAASLARR